MGLVAGVSTLQTAQNDSKESNITIGDSAFTPDAISNATNMTVNNTTISATPSKTKVQTTTNTKSSSKKKHSDSKHSSSSTDKNSGGGSSSGGSSSGGSSNNGGSSSSGHHQGNSPSGSNSHR